MRKKIGLFMVGVALIAGVAEVNAWPGKRFDSTTNTCRSIGSGKLEWESRPWGTGGRGFDRVCKSCHYRDNDKGVPFLYVESKCSKAWNRIFAQKKVKCAQDGSWDSLSMDELLKVNDYLYRFAKGSQDIYHNYL